MKKGKLKDPVTVNILLGQVSYEQQNFEDATKFFRTALDRLTDLKIKDKKLLEKRQDKLRAQALTWLTYTEKEARRVKTLELRRKRLRRKLAFLKYSSNLQEIPLFSSRNSSLFSICQLFQSISGKNASPSKSFNTRVIIKEDANGSNNL